MKKLGFIGIGNMGGAMLQSIINKGNVEVSVYDVNTALYDNFKQYQEVHPSETIQEVVEASELIFLTVKPQFYEVVLNQIKQYLNENQMIITVAPGYSLERVSGQLDGHKKVVRTMPNTPAMVGLGVTAYAYEKDYFSDEEVNALQGYFECFGSAYALPENLMDAVVPVSGSSPAYAYMFIEAMADAGVKFGLPRNMAYEMAAQTLKGASEMVLQTKQHPGVLKDAVTSPGGTTIEAVAKLEETGFRSSVIEAMTVCYNKTKSMGK